MSDTIKIKVNVDDAKALASLTNLENIVKRLNNTPLNIPSGGGSSSGGRGSTAGALKDITVAATNLDTRLANLSNSVKNASDSGKYAKENFNGLSQSVSSAKTQLTELTSQYKSGKISQEEYAAGVKKISAESGNLTNQFANLKGNIKETSGLTKLLGDDFVKIAAKQAAWQLLGAAVAGVKNSLSEALATMKEVDSELATIRKVTGMSESEAAALGKGSYSIASKYGVEASEYLENVGTFARAGYKEASEGLGELAIKTQLVGDATQEIASQFLLSADAAWKYHGNVEQLSLVLDKANEIDNNYATSIQKIAEGFPIVANVAAMAGMSVDQTMAALGTITATTQESGTKAATALRALILNILGDTTTEISEGVTATEESVNSLGQILKKYAPDAVAAAEATGKLINPMEAIEALSKAAKDGLLSEADLMSMVSALGGKLRTNQLLALLENFDMYTDMLQTMTTAFGSADKEYQVMMDTWEAKANVLKNTWTEFISILVDTKAIKVSLDVITGFIKVLDSDFGHFALTVAGVTAATALFSKGLAALNATAFVSTLTGMLKSVTDFKAGIALLTETVKANPLLWGVAAGTAAIYGIVKAVDALTVTYDEQVEKVEELESAYEAAYGQGSRLDELRNKTSALTEAEKEELKILEARAKAQQLLIDGEKQKEYQLWKGGWTNTYTNGVWDENGTYTGESSTSKAQERLKGFRSEVEKLTKAYGELDKDGIPKMTNREFATGLAEIASRYSDIVDQVENYKDAGFEIPQELQDIVDLYNELNTYAAELAGTEGDLASSASEAGDALESAAQNAASLNDEISGAAGALSDFQQAVNALGDPQATLKGYADIFEQIKQDLSEGKINSATLQVARQQFLTDEEKQALGYDIERENAFLQQSVLYTHDAENAMDGLIEKARAAADETGSIALNGKEIAKVAEDGSIAFSSIEDLAAALNEPVQVIEALLGTTRDYTTDVIRSAEDAKTVIDEVNRLLEETGGIAGSSAQEIVNAIAQATGAATGEDLKNIITELQNLGLIDLSNISEADLTNIISQVLNLAEAEEKVDKNPRIEVTADTKGAERNVANVQGKVDGLHGNTVTVNVDTSAGERRLSWFQSLLQSIGRTAVTATVGVVTNAITGGRSSGALKRRAKGGKGGGWAVVNDERTDGSAPELILDGDRAYIANDGKPAMVHLSPNATVLTADQTKDALSSKATEFPRFAGGWLSNAWNKVKKAASNAYNNAINYVKSKLGGSSTSYNPSSKTYTPSSSPSRSSSSASSSASKWGNTLNNGFVGSNQTSWGSGFSTGYSNGYSDGYSSGGYSGYSDSGGWGGGSSDYGYTGTAAQQNQTDPLDELSKEISDTLKNLDSRITLAQNQKNVSQEQSLQNEAISYLNSAISRYNALGKGETSTEVTDLRNKIYSYQKAHDEAPVKALEDKISKYLENINAQIEKANNEGNTDQADLLRKQAMEAIKGYEGEYNALGYGNTSTEVLDLLNKSYDYQQDIRDALQNKIDDYLGNIDKQISLAASNDDDEKVKALRDQAMSAITGFVQDWKNLGLKEDSDEIIDLLQKSNDYKEAIIASFKESLSNQLSLIDAQIALAQNQGNTSKEQELNGDAIKAIFEQIKAFREMGYGEDSQEILELKNKAFGYGGNVVGGIVEILQAANDAADKAKQYADLQKEIQEKQEALENAKHQRTVRYFNSETGQWEWMEDEKQIQQAQDDLKSAQDELEQLKREALINYVEKIGTDAIRNSVESGIYDPDGVLEKLGVVSARLAESVEQAKLMPSVSNDSHDIIYRFGNLQLTPGQAHDMTVEELINEIDKYNLT